MSTLSTLMVEPAPVRSLVERAREGDRDAFDTLGRACRGKIEAFIVSRIRPQFRRRIEAEELVQETLARAFESLDRFHGADQDAFDAWITGIARNVLLKAFEKLGAAQPLKLERDVTADGPSPSKVLLRDERFDRLQQAVETLSGDHQQVIRLARIEGLPLDEVASRMGRSHDAVKKLLWRALKELRKAFGDTESLHLAPRNLEPGGAQPGEPHAGGDGHGR
jgi:RNA polymerase sigma-70 factor, ECF subfamily